MPPEFSEQMPTVAEFQALRSVAGLSAYSHKATQLSLKNGLFGVWLRDGSELVGMGRLVGDGGGFAQVTDVAIHPRLQRQGWGSKVMERLMHWADKELPAGCYISLIADPGAEQLYEQHGFSMRVGMARRVP